ncbi:MAG: MBL fold metallo-hydrolase [Alphaproteobacteria bacterium]|nr:MBL fold metallo-hydrolase [Alphaproteobacteria bacterium]
MQQTNNVKFDVLNMPPENTNSVLVSSGGDCVIFDAWGRAADWVHEFDSRGVRLRAIYSTHGHPDHISAAPDLVRKYNVPWFIDADDLFLIGQNNNILDYYSLPHIELGNVHPTSMPDGPLNILPGIKMEIIKTPGHTPGGVVFWFPDFRILLSGDTVFDECLGRYDLPGGDRHKLWDSVERLYKMDFSDDTFVVHGHGANSTIKQLKLHNPWFRAR